jgi:uncharacterized membrane protein
MSLIRPLLIGCATGLRSMSPLAVVSALRRRPDTPAILDNKGVTAALIGLALLEAAGDKLPVAPDRIAPLGIAARALTGGAAGAALAPRRQRVAAVALGAAGAVAAGYLSFHLRQRAMRRFGQISTGLVEDTIAGGAALWLARGRPI